MALALSTKQFCSKLLGEAKQSLRGGDDSAQKAAMAHMSKITGLLVQGTLNENVAVKYKLHLSFAIQQ